MLWAQQHWAAELYNDKTPIDAYVVLVLEVEKLC